MPSNIEIKAYARDFAGIRSRAEKLSDTQVQVIPQEDIFFNVGEGRLKLRILAAKQSQLIYYTRPDQEGPKRSYYHITRSADPQNLRRVLELACGIRGVVHKTRYLYLVGQTRIHLDDVEGLGQFMELEVMLEDGQSDAEGQKIAEDLMAALGEETGDLIDGAYMDLIDGVETLAGVPSIVFGLFGFVLFVTALHFRFSLLSGALTLVCLLLPTFIRTSEEALKAVPRGHREAALALGSTRWQAIWHVVLRAALPGIITGFILCIGRIVGETACLYYHNGWQLCHADIATIRRADVVAASFLPCNGD